MAGDASALRSRRARHRPAEVRAGQARRSSSTPSRGDHPCAAASCGAMHGMELPFVFDHPDAISFMTGSGADRYALAAAMSGAWVSFARTGNPGTPASAVARLQPGRRGPRWFSALESNWSTTRTARSARRSTRCARDDSAAQIRGHQPLLVGTRHRAPQDRRSSRRLPDCLIRRSGHRRDTRRADASVPERTSCPDVPTHRCVTARRLSRPSRRSQPTHRSCRSPVRPRSGSCPAPGTTAPMCSSPQPLRCCASGVGSSRSTRAPRRSDRPSHERSAACRHVCGTRPASRHGECRRPMRRRPFVPGRDRS